MKKDIHPTTYRPVVFQDTGADFSVLIRSTAPTDETTKWTDGKEYPLVKMHVSSASHPFYTGEQKVLDIAGRVDKFNARRKAADKAAEARTGAAKKAVSRSEKKSSESKKIGEKSAKTSAKAESNKPAETVSAA